jgi:hypothetical protein
MEVMSIPGLENRDQLYLMDPTEQVLIFYLMTEAEAAFENLCLFIQN